MDRTFTKFLTLVLTVFLGLTVDVSAQRRGANGNANGNKVAAVAPLKLTLPLKKDSVRFVLIGDTGTGTDKQQQLADLLLRSRQSFPFEFVLMVGDNLYGGEKPADYKTKFEDVYRPLIDQQVKFYAALGNHDEPAQRFYEHFNMDGKEYYRFTSGNVAFYALEQQLHGQETDRLAAK